MSVSGSQWRNIICLSVVLLVATLHAAEPYGLNERLPIGAFLNGKLPPAVLVQTGKWAVVDAFTNITVDDPTIAHSRARDAIGSTFPPGRGRSFLS